MTRSVDILPMRVPVSGCTMNEGNEEDVPSPTDLRHPEDAREWERTAPARPGRAEVFEAFGRELAALGKRPLAVLELGSGPGFLAAYLMLSATTATVRASETSGLTCP